MKNFSIKRFRHIKISKILSQSFLFITLIVFLITTALSAFLYDQFYRLTYTSIGKNMVERLSQNSTQLNLLKNQIYSIGMYLVSDTDIIKASLTNEADPVDKYLLVRKLAYFANTNKLVHSICLFNSSNQEIISNLGASSKWVYDKDLQTYINSIDYKATPIFTPRILESGTLPTIKKNVFSISFNVGSKSSTDNKTNFNSNIIINVNAIDFFKNFSASDELSRSNTILFDNKGKLIIDTNGQNFNQVRSESYITEITNSTNKDGFLLVDINGEKMLVTYLKSSVFNWTLVNLSPYNDIFSSLITFKKIIYYSSLVLFLIGILYALFASYRLYTPFRNIKKQFNSNDTSNNSYFYDEAKHIKDSFTKLNKDNETLEKSLTSNLALAKDTYLRQLIRGTLDENIDEFRNKFSALKINYLEGQVCVIFFKIEIKEKTKRNLDTNQISDIYNIMQNNFYLYNVDFLFLETELNCCKVVSQFINDLSIFDLASKIQQSICKALNFSVSVVIGCVVNSLLEVSTSYNNCGELLPYLFVKETGTILTNDSLNLSTRSTNCEISTQKEHLFVAIKTANFSQTSIIIDEIFNYISNCTYDLVRLTINQLILEIISFSNSILFDIEDSLSFNNIYKNVNSISTLAETQLFFTLTCGAIIRKIDDKNKNPKKHLINDIKAYLKENFASQNLSGEYIADVFKLTPGYLGKLFSDAEGCSMVDYINDIRLSKASALLISTSLLINQISEQCGFANRTYFATLFKKKYGLTPKAYREQNRVNSGIL